VAKTASKKKPEDIVEVFGEEDVPQRSEAWFELRRGIPTASKFAAILAEGKDGGPSLTRAAYMDKLAGEILTGQIDEEFKTEAMRRGIEMEAEALEWYERTHFVDMERVGFVRRTVHPPLGQPFVVGCSPDARVPKLRRLVQIKTERPDLLIQRVRRGAAGFPTQHRAQCQGEMWVEGAETCDLVIFYRGWKSPPKFTMERDDKFISLLAEQVEKFVYELNMLVKQIKETGKGWK